MSDAAQAYWDANAEAPYTFVHPLERAWLAALPKGARILDYGCGHGRMTAELAAVGWPNVVGVDFAAGMIARGRREHPGLDLRHIGALPVAEPDAAFDAAILFAVLTCIPANADQHALIAELRRLIRPGGLLYVSDYLLQTDVRYAARYEAGLARHGVLGVWDREDGGAFRHHTREALGALLSEFEPVAERELETKTLSGANATAIQLLVRRA
jgi:SAM-dependent methyltransferase